MLERLLSIMVFRE